MLDYQHLLFVTAFTICLPVISIVVQFFFIPDLLDAASFSYLVGSACDGVAGVVDSRTLPLASVQCLRVFINEMTHDQIVNYAEVYVGTMLFFVYSLYSALKELRHDIFRKQGRVLFCIVVLAESVVLNVIYNASERIQEETELLDVTVDAENILEPPANDPMRPLIRTTVYISTAVRIFILAVLFVFCLYPDARLTAEEAGAMEQRRMPNEGPLAMALRRAYAFAFMVITALMGFALLLFYLPDRHEPLYVSFLVGNRCEGVAGAGSDAAICEDRPGQCDALTCEQRRLCVAQFIEERLEEDHMTFSVACTAPAGGGEREVDRAREGSRRRAVCLPAPALVQT